MKLIKAKNAEFRQKIDTWKRRADERKREQQRIFQHSKKLKVTFEKNQEDFNIEKERVIAIVIDYKSFSAEIENIEKKEKILNDFLA